ncbi:MAG: DUF134 domain-containing protein [Tissierellia bacterium]|mgnify:CR=1 FL=1|nr:DUF134 domain-containing protein [Tissierellia bacterium]
MARRTRCRKIEFFPDTSYFLPLGKDDGVSIELTLEELEALRLKDIKGLTQQECADRMEVSRQTFQNIIDKARNKVAVALTEGLAITIKGGYFKSSYCEIKCKDCDSTYSIQYPEDRQTCPICNSLDVYCNNRHRKCNRWCERD